LSDAAAMIEAAIDYDGEDEVGQVDMDRTTAIVDRVQAEMQSLLDQPSTERLRDGLVVVLAGPRNAGKSSLFNALVEREAAIVTSIAGTTRDALEAQVVRAGVPFRLVDTAGLVEETDDPVERIGIARARGLIGEADILLWLGSVTDAPAGAWLIAAKADLCPGPGIPTSIHQPESVAALWSRLVEHGSSMLSAGDDLSLSRRQRDIVSHVLPLLASASAETDILIKADHLRVARKALGALTGRDATLALLNALFGRFCLGK
jgi:tRNA modification GTPase